MPIQDSSLELETLMNLRPLKGLFMVTGLNGLQTSSAILSSSGHEEVKGGLGQHMIHQQLPVTKHQSQSPQQQSIYPQFTQQQLLVDDLSETQSSSSITLDSPFPPISKSLTKVKVIFWVNELRRYHFLWKTGRMNSAHAAELHHLLCKIEDKMAHPFLTPQVLGETRLGRVMKSFQHGGFDARSKKVAQRVIQYWRKLCLEA